MSQQLIYTSAPRGLKPGSHGYCTVAATSGMPVNLAERLEALSGYRHLFPPSDPQAPLNPVVHSFVRVNLGGRAYFVLSRISDAGLDYSQRNNKLAHHLALDKSELPLAGPAWVLSQPGLFVTEWNAEPRILAAPRTPAKENLAPTICRHWEQLTGDAGWGGVLAESAARRAPTFIVYQPGTAVLPLILESQSLLSPQARWGATFSTFFTKLPAGVDCQWRCVVAGSPEARSARTNPDALIIDLTRELPAAEGGPLVAAARTGQIEEPVEVAAGIVEDRPATQSRSRARNVRTVAEDDYGVEVDNMPPAAPRGVAAAPRLRSGKQSSSKSARNNRMLLAAAGVLILAAGVLTGVGLERHLAKGRIVEATQFAKTESAEPKPVEASVSVAHQSSHPSQPSDDTSRNFDEKGDPDNTPADIQRSETGEAVKIDAGVVTPREDRVPDSNGENLNQLDLNKLVRLPNVELAFPPIPSSYAEQGKIIEVKHDLKRLPQRVELIGANSLGIDEAFYLEEVSTDGDTSTFDLKVLIPTDAVGRAEKREKVAELLVTSDMISLRSRHVADKRTLLQAAISDCAAVLASIDSNRYQVVAFRGAIKMPPFEGNAKRATQTIAIPASTTRALQLHILTELKSIPVAIQESDTIYDFGSGIRLRFSVHPGELQCTTLVTNDQVEAPMSYEDITKLKGRDQEQLNDMLNACKLIPKVLDYRIDIDVSGLNVTVAGSKLEKTQ